MWMQISHEIETEEKSTMSYIFCMGGGAISWESKLQSVVTLSMIEAQYIVVTYVVKKPFD